MRRNFGKTLYEMPELLTVGDIADILKISRVTVIRRIKNGEMQGIRVGANFRIPKEFLISYLENSLTGKDENSGIPYSEASDEQGADS